jgi:hypothetical protein
MNIGLEIGHGKDYRVTGDKDPGLFLEDGTSERDVCMIYGDALRGYIQQSVAGYSCNRSNSGRIKDRAETMIRRGVDVIVSFHLGFTPDGEPGRRVAYATPQSRRLAETLAQAIGCPAVAVDLDHGLLRVNPSVEIQLGSVSCSAEMQEVSSPEWGEEFVRSVVRSILSLRSVYSLA